jgi:tetratricopeptide (TPR) repeat protein
MSLNTIKTYSFCLLISLVLVSFGFVSLKAQTIEENRKKAYELVDQSKFYEALPYLEKLAAAEPNNPEHQKYLGFAYIAKNRVETSPEAKREARIKARAALIKARELGYVDLQLEALIDGLAADGSEKGKFSFHPKADKLMEEAEVFFAQGKFDEALKKYQEAMEIDAQIYYAALFSGDVYLQKGDYKEAEFWYKKAIEINPFIETAYRYSATPLMRQKKYEEALPRYIEAYITSPYNKLAISGISNWSQVTGRRVGHPRVDIPKEEIGKDGKPTTVIAVNPLANDGSMAWIAYSATRITWKETKFAQTYPNERNYRHSVQEEVDALRSVVRMAKESKPKKLNPQFELIEKLDKEGLLEAYILLALADNGIAQEHYKYLRTNRDKLRQDVTNYVVQK